MRSKLVNMKDIESLLQRLDKTLREYNPTFYGLLYPPLSGDEVVSKLAELGCDDGDLKAWFGWRNGIDPDADPDVECMIFYFGAMPMSLDAVIGTVRARERTRVWEEHFIPLATDGTGLYLLFNNKAGANYGKIYLYSVSLLFIEPVSYYDSLAAFIETTILDYEQEALVYDAHENWLDEDSRKHEEIAAGVNVGSDHWKR